MEINEEKLRARLARAKGGHRKVLQGKLDTMVAKRGTVEVTPAPVRAPKKKASLKKK